MREINITFIVTIFITYITWLHIIINIITHCHNIIIVVYSALQYSIAQHSIWHSIAQHSIA